MVDRGLTDRAVDLFFLTEPIMLKPSGMRMAEPLATAALATAAVEVCVRACVCACVCVCARARARARVRACVRACVELFPSPTQFPMQH